MYFYLEHISIWISTYPHNRIPEILDSMFTVAIMASCDTSVPPTPERIMFTALNRDERVFKECSLVLNYICISDDSYDVLKAVVNMWFTGEDFKDECYDENPLQDLCLSGSPGRWMRPSRICKNIDLLRPADQWLLRKQAEYGITRITLGEKGKLLEEKLSKTSVPAEIKPLKISMLEAIPGWIKMDMPDMRKEVLYFMTHVLMTEYGEKLWKMTVDVHDIGQYMPWYTAVERMNDILTLEVE